MLLDGRCFYTGFFYICFVSSKLTCKIYLRNRLHLLIQCVSADLINIILKLICLVFKGSILLHCQ